MKNFLLAYLLCISVHSYAQQDISNLLQGKLGCGILSGSTAQNSERRTGEMLIQLDKGIAIQSVTSPTTERNSLAFHLIAPVAPNWNIYLIGFDESKVDAQKALDQIRQRPGVRAAQLNFRSTERDVEPNDPSWSQQGDMNLINAPAAWSVSTGGLSPAGDTIVVAVLEKGALLSHPDIAPNRWYNWGEIPNNGIDDDGNGYIDDFGGWNPRDTSDSPGTIGTHGTGVNGIIGAVGNNGEGVTGVNWRVKLMNLASVEYESEIIAAYYYVNNMRRIYNQTNGAKGAFVVATNASFGLDLAQAADHPLWCAVYDSLGQNGILSMGATTNQNVNVDVQGDMPTACTSEFLITVNNVDQQGVKWVNTGYGAASIDLAAPGEATYTTAYINNSVPGYAKLGGTSAATPHVSGSVALLYSFDCAVFTSDALTDPITCARRVRDAILDHTEPAPSLSGITKTGGYLNLANSLGAVEDICDGVVGVLDLISFKSYNQTNMMEIFYQTPNFEEYQFRVFNMLGQLMYEEALHPKQFASNKVEYDAHNLPAGVYVMSISRGKNIVSRKFPKF